MITLLILIAFLTAAANVTFAETAQTNVIISDSIAPMKLEVDSNSGNASETKTVTLTNTGKVATEYIVYVEQTGGKENTKSNFELSESKITVQPGESHKVEISIPVQNINPNSEEYKLKIIRNPDTQTPVGYIIPIIFTGTETEDGSASKGGSSSGSAVAAQSRNGNEENEENGSETVTRSIETNKAEANGTKADDREKLKILIGILLLLILAVVVLIGIIVWKKMKAESK
ncbi:MAG: hypothetical protein LBE57_00980 [Methanosarcinales archaeon]|nr:hypothetical protein [Methanosarcinales archaeon]